MTDLDRMSLALRIGDLADRLLDLQSEQQKTLTELLQSLQDYADDLSLSLKQPNTSEKG